MKSSAYVTSDGVRHCGIGRDRRNQLRKIWPEFCVWRSEDAEEGKEIALDWPMGREVAVAILLLRLKTRTALSGELVHEENRHIQQRKGKATSTFARRYSVHAHPLCKGEIHYKINWHFLCRM